MSDDQTPDPEQGAVESDSALGPWLRAGRESAGLGREAVAAALHLDTAVIAALENDDFATLGAPVFVKGHLKALAGHVGLDVDEAMRRYASTAGETGSQPPELVVNYQQPIRRNKVAPLVFLVAALLVIAALVALVMLWPRASAPAAAVAQNPSADEPVSQQQVAEPVVSETQSVDPNPDFASRLAEARARSAQAPGSEAPQTVAAPVQPAPDVAAAATGSGLELRFSAECWFEVRDAEGRRLATGTGAAGGTRRVDGARPLSVTLGVADAVTVVLDGEPVTIPDAARRGRSARLTLR